MDFDDYGQPKKDANLPIVEFYADAVKDQVASKMAGSPKFRNIEMVTIKFPADRQRSVVRPAHSEWKKHKGEIVTYAMRFREQYERFKAGQVQVVDGTPLDEAPFLSMAQRKALKALQVYTVEQLANLEGQPLKNVGPEGRTMQQQAQAYLDRASGTADVTRLSAENAQLRQTLADMTASNQSVPGPFAGQSDDELKDMIKDATGQAPRGNPRRETLERMAAEASAAA